MAVDRESAHYDRSWLADFLSPWHIRVGHKDPSRLADRSPVLRHAKNCMGALRRAGVLLLYSIHHRVERQHRPRIPAGDADQQKV